MPSDPAFAQSKGTNEHEPVRQKRSAGMKALAAGIAIAAIGASILAVTVAYGAERHARLVEAKDRWDPENVFRLNHNIEPSAA